MSGTPPERPAKQAARVELTVLLLRELPAKRLLGCLRQAKGVDKGAAALEALYVAVAAQDVATHVSRVLVYLREDEVTVPEGHEGKGGGERKQQWSQWRGRVWPLRMEGKGRKVTGEALC